MNSNIQAETLSLLEEMEARRQEEDPLFDISSESDDEGITYSVTTTPEYMRRMRQAINSFSEDEYKDLVSRFGIGHLIFGWAWDEEDRAYRNDETGELMDEETFIALRDQIVDWQVDYFAKWPVDEDEEPKEKDDPNVLALLLLGIITLGAWEAGTRAALQDASIIQYVVGRGGFDQMADDDWSWLEEWLLGQYGFLSGFSQDIADGALSEAEIASRAYLYFSSAIAAFEQGRMKGQDEGLNLTRHPGDCTSQCCARDRCFWRYIRRRDRIVIHWIRTAKESCFTCIDRARCQPVVFMLDTGEHRNMLCYETADAG